MQYAHRLVFGLVFTALAAAGAAPLFAQAGGLLETLEVGNIQNEIAGGRDQRGNQESEQEQPDAGRQGGERADGQVNAGNGGWPTVDLNPSGAPGRITRGPGGYLSLIKILAFWILFAIWVATMDWLNHDCSYTQQPYAIWNTVVFFTFVGAAVLCWMTPFVVGYTLMCLAYLGSMGTYTVIRNGSVDPHERILTPSHLRYVFAKVGQKVGLKISAEKKAAYEHGAPVDLSAQGGETDRDNSANLLLARQSPGFIIAKDLIADVIDKRGDRVRLDFSQEQVAVKYQIDGVWHDAESFESEVGDVILAVLKTLANLEINERRKKQTGTFGAEYHNVKYIGRLESQGTKSGERVVLGLDDGSQAFNTFEDLGMREKLSEQFKKLMMTQAGFMIISSLPDGGLTTSINVSLEETDRLMRNFVTIEDEANRQLEIQNVETTTFNKAAGETPATVLPKLLRTYPDAILVRELADSETIRILCRQVHEKRLAIGGIRAREAPEALLRILMLKVPAKEFAPSVTAVLNQRLIRMLCTECRVPFEPTADILKKLGIPAGRIEALYRVPTEEEMDKPCTVCGGIGYLGRTSLFELLVVDDKIREALLSKPKIDELKKVARRAGMRTLQEEGVLLVAKGITSLNELTRVLKQ